MNENFFFILSVNANSSTIDLLVGLSTMTETLLTSMCKTETLLTSMCNTEVDTTMHQ